MAPENWVARYGCIALIVACFALIGAIIAGPMLRPLWLPQVTIAQFAQGGTR